MLLMEYLVNGAVILMLLLFFTILSAETTSIRIFNQRKTIAELVFHFRVLWRQLVTSRK